MNNYHVTRINRFQDKFNNISIEDYFDIVGINDNEKINFIHNVKSNNTINLEIRFTKNNILYDILELPLDICREIFEYYSIDYIFINLNIVYNSITSPFSAPNWNLINVKHNISIPIDLTEYYKGIVHFHNSLNNIQWSPAIDIDKDILDFIQKINHFDYMLDNNNFIGYNLI
jgi:hypothetical protein